MPDFMGRGHELFIKFLFNDYSWIIQVHTDKKIRNLIKSNRNQIVCTIFRLILNQTDVRLIVNQSKNGKYNLISV